MFQKRKKFKVETTPEARLTDRWDQQVFFITKKYPDAQERISAIVKNHASESDQSDGFIPSEEALLELAELCNKLQNHV